ncbi:hypothetical protein MRB53_041075 [Persea americana]|nr:hypothetical protein MRB53_041075 [Persea americana]
MTVARLPTFYALPDFILAFLPCYLQIVCYFGDRGVWRCSEHRSDASLPPPGHIGQTPRRLLPPKATLPNYYTSGYCSEPNANSLALESRT